jgi:metallopeptidase MepB
MRKPPQVPPLFQGTPGSIIEDARRLISSSHKVQDHVVQTFHSDSATFASVLLLLAHSKNVWSTESNILCFYKDVSSYPSLRNASGEAQKLLNDHRLEAGMREDLFQLVDTVSKKNEDLDPESHLLLEKERKDYIRDGMGLPAGAQRERFKEIRQRISQLKIDFRKNQSEESGGIWFFLREWEGLPEGHLSGLEKGTGENEGKLRVTFGSQPFSSVMRYCKNSETRMRVQTGHENKCPKNVPYSKR